MKLIKSIFFCLFLIISLNSCSSSNDDIFISDPSELKKEVIAQEINFEIKIINVNNEPISGVSISLDTTSFHDQGITNSDGMVNLLTHRRSGEPLLFRFKGKEVRATETINKLPTNLRSPSITFQVINNYSVKASHYAVDGLYR